MSEARYLVGDVFDRLAKISDGSVDLIVTSPPFLALRSYLPADHPDKGKEIGSEATPADFLSTLIALTLEWRRVLAPHGSICVELGDTYAGSGGAGGDYNDGGLRDGAPKFAGSMSASQGRRGQPTGAGGTGWPLDKSLCLLPTLYPASLAYGRNLLNPDDTLEPWRVRNLVVWHRPNPPVGALGDKVRPSTSYVTVACTSRTRWFDLDAERTEPSPNTHARPSNHAGRKGNPDGQRSTLGPYVGNENPAGAPPLDCWLDATPDDVWTLSTQPYKGSHYATFPITLPRKLINLMCPRQVCVECGEPRRRITGEAEYVQSRNGNTPAVLDQREGRQVDPHARQWDTRGMGDNSVTRVAPTLGWTDCGHNSWRRGIVLDPFCGSGTTLVAASELGRNSIGIDLDSKNLQLARDRCGMFLVEEETDARTA